MERIPLKKRSTVVQTEPVELDVRTKGARRRHSSALQQQPNEFDGLLKNISARWRQAHEPFGEIGVRLVPSWITKDLEEERAIVDLIESDAPSGRLAQVIDDLSEKISRAEDKVQEELDRACEQHEWSDYDFAVQRCNRLKALRPLVEAHWEEAYERQSKWRKIKRRRWWNVPKGIRREAFERRLAAVHEAGHFTIARHFGLHAYAGVWPVYDADIDETDFVGQCVWWKPDGLSQNKERMIAVAGVIAEKLWFEPKAIREMFEHFYWREGFMSPLDWNGCGCEPGQPDEHLILAAKRVVKLFDPDHGKLWPHVVRVSRDLINVQRQACNWDPPSMTGSWSLCRPAVAYFPEIEIDTER